MDHDRGVTVRWGVAGPGPVAGKVLRDLAYVPNAALTAVGSRSADVEESVLLRYPGGRSALLFASLRSPAPGEARVLGTSGWIQVPPRFHYPSRIVLHRYGHDPEAIDAPLTGAGYTHELVEVTERVAGGHTESEIMPLADTVAVQDVLGEIADQLGMRVIEGPAELP